MSHETFHAIRQHPNGDFVVTTKCSNDDAPPHEWTMEYFRHEFPDFTNEQRVASFLLMSLYGGDVFYPVRWKKMLKLAEEYNENSFKETGRYPYEFIYNPAPIESYKRSIQKIMEEPDGYIPSEYRDLPISDTVEAYERYFATRKQQQLDAVNGLIKHINAVPVESKTKFIIMLHDAEEYIASYRKNSRKVRVSKDRADAYIFNMTQAEADAIMRRFAQSTHAQMITI